MPIALTPIYLGVGSSEPDFDIQYFPETLRLTVDKASATTDQTLYEWFFNGESVLPLWPERNVYEAVITSEAQIGNYSVVATNACGSTEVSRQVTYTPPPCVVIPSAAKVPNTDPNYDFGAYPGDVFMRILPNGGATPPYTYEWYHDGILIDGAVLDNYSAPINDAAGLGVYTAVIRNPCSSAQVSWTYTMTAVCVVPAIPALDPATVDVTAWGQRQSWSVVPTQGDLPMTFTLDRDGTQLEQKNNGSFTVTFNSENDMGVYTVTVSNVCGVVSSSSTVTSSVPGVALPIVSVLPASYDWNGPASDTTQFVATLENPTEAGAVTWYWTFGPSGPTPGLMQGIIPGETTDTLDVLITSVAQVGTYRAYATNAAGESLPGVGAIVNVAAVPPIIDAGPDGTFQYGGEFPPPVIQLAGTSIPGTDPAPTYYWTIVSGITDNNLTTWSDRTSLTTTVQFGNYTRPNGTQFILALTATTNDTSQVVDIVIYTKTGF